MADRTSKRRRRERKSKNTAPIQPAQDIEAPGESAELTSPRTRTPASHIDDVSMSPAVEEIDGNADTITGTAATETATAIDTEDAVNKECACNEQTKSLFFSLLNKDCRIKIYDAMLGFNDNYKCQPQVLRTCKKLKEEALQSLYGANNTFDIKLITSAKVVNGIEYFDEWPQYLLKCERLRYRIGPRRSIMATSVAFSGMTAYESPVDMSSPDCAAETKFHSLCRFLLQDHDLKFLCLDLGFLSDEVRARGAPQLRSAVVDLYPFRLIRTPGLQVTAVNAIHPLDQRRSPTELLSTVSLTPELAVRQIHNKLAKFEERMVAYLEGTSRLSDDDEAFAHCFMEYKSYGRNPDGSLPGSSTTYLIELIIGHAIDLNLSKGPATTPEDHRHLVYAIKHDIVELELACLSMGLNAEELLEKSFEER